MNNITMSVIAIVVVLGGWWLFRDSAGAPATNTETTATTNESVSGDGSDVQAQTIMMDGSEFKYEPAIISAKVGQPVAVIYKNVGQYPHDFVIDELSVKSQVIKAGETGTFTFTPSSAGTFAFYCSLPNHRENGMHGVITVTE